MTDLQTYSKKALGLIDLTSLNLDDTDADIVQLCHQALTEYGHVAAVCVYPKFVGLARRTLDELDLNDVKVATVTNFPSGTLDIQTVLQETESAIGDGADEIDVVLPYSDFIKGNLEHCEQILTESKQACADHTVLKVIIESGMLDDVATINAASEFAIDCGADFIKTSTGKVKINATLESAEAMLTAIKNNGAQVGFKAAGGIKTSEDAMAYIKQAESLMGPDWVSARNYRFGASSLLGNLVSTLSGDHTQNNPSSEY